MEKEDYKNLYHPFLDPESPHYEGSTTRDFSDTCPSRSKKAKTTGKGKKKKTMKRGKKCSLQKGHEGQHEYWQFPPGVRVRVWGD
jgi:hypothetical protein